MDLSDRMNLPPDKPDSIMKIVEGTGEPKHFINKVAREFHEKYKLSPTGEKPQIVLIVAINTGVFNIGASGDGSIPTEFVKDFGFALKDVCDKYWTPT